MKDEGYEPITFKLTSTQALMLHNGMLADPLYKWTKLIKEISGKRKKTEKDHADLAKLEWFGSLYIGADEKTVVVPGEMIEAMVIEASKKQRLGKEFKAAIMCDGAWPLEFSGPKDLEKLYADGRFVDRRAVKVQMSRVIRTRPVFPEWSLKIVVHYLASMVNKSAVVEAIQHAGKFVGLAEMRPRYGRFDVEVLSK